MDDFTRVRELLGIVCDSTSAWHTLRIGELKALLALAGGDLEQALIWTEWTQEFNASVFSAERAAFYRCLHTLLLLAMEEQRDPDQYMEAFARMYGTDILETVLASLNGDLRFHGLTAVDDAFSALPAHRAMLAAYEKLQQAKRRFWQA